ncbi:response regulator [Reyranella sp. CPCC 100927]|uniref:response regulator n=1 Tax=Reyranella sp. CPCC 100927 TaxID=2599616 RepID=UPI0011B6B33D|nr:response regulator [Reyranella sp. CPCC 100927]TWT03111.1 response regulator [Reyranella sp. CPCC 100927]
MKPLSECRVLIVESDFGVGLKLLREFSDEGCRGVKLVRTLEGALRELSVTPPDAVALDLDVRGKHATPIADVLAAHNVPFVVVSGPSTGAAATEHDSLKTFPAREIVSRLTTAITQRKAA